MIVDKRERLCRVYPTVNSLNPIDVTIEPLAQPPVKITIPQTTVWPGEMETMLAALRRADQEAGELVTHLQTQAERSATDRSQTPC